MRGEEGFSLIEVLVAFAILALTLATVYQTLMIGTRSAREAELRDAAQIYAEAMLTSLGRETRFGAGETEGRFNDSRFAWKLTVSPFFETGRNRNRGQIELYTVILTVLWGDRSMSIETLRLVSRDAGR